MKIRPSLICLLSSFLLSPSAFSQGELTPRGAPTPTMKTLDQVEARIPIDAVHTPGDDTSEFVIPAGSSGSYYLTGNLNVGKENGIKVAAVGVTIDLNGFSVQRTANTGGAGIRIENTASACVVKNGSIRDFEAGIHARPNIDSSQGATAGRVYQVTVTNCSLKGIIAGSGWEIEKCVLSGNGGGINATRGCTIKHCTITFSTENTGISLNSGTVLGCTVSFNKGTGIATAQASTILDCLAEGNNGNGISTVFNSTISRCTSWANDLNGISLGSSGKVSGCTAFGNGVDGIVASRDSELLDNACTSNSAAVGVENGAGIHVTGSANRIRANNTTGNAIGIRAEGAGNLIDGNHVRNNTGPGIQVPLVNGKNVIIRNVAGNNVNSYTGIAAGNQVAPIDANFTVTSPFANFQN